MFQMPEPAASFRILHPDDGPAAELLNPEGQGLCVLSCEHASNRVPRALGALGLGAEDLSSHIAWDPGALAVAERLSAVLDAPLVAQRFSRLVIDCNRAPGEPGSIAERSEQRSIPGNHGLSEAEIEARIAEVYAPFHAALEHAMVSRLEAGSSPVLVTIHSFTPVFLGQAREVELGVLHDTDSRLADRLLARAASLTGLAVRRNEPYGPADRVMHTLQRHGQRHGVMNVMLEIRNDLLADGVAVDRIAERLAAWVRDALQIDHANPGVG
ncbi:MAG: N-formylglutamate amidohydrolase [Chromatiales bacterium]|jgi:predicted N-formylglutamate amidohydrolase